MKSLGRLFVDPLAGGKARRLFAAPVLAPKVLALRLLAVSFLVVSLFGAVPARAQQVLLDKPVRAGELTLFPGIADESAYYYVLDKLRLATHDNNLPQFSLLRYVNNVRSGAGEAEAREGEGGAILHALVTLEVSQDQLREAQRELRRLKPSARIEGPVIFKSGRFALVSSFAETDGTLTKKVVGLGNAPLLDGEKAAVSLLLTKEGARILWQSFQAPTPDISFSFEMELEGFRSPKRGLIEANFDQIYEHQGFAAGLATPYLAAEIKAAFDDLQRSGAIKVTQTGDDAKIDELITTAYNKLADMMFQPLQGTGTPDLASLAGAGAGGGSILDKATALLASSRQDAREENERIRRQNLEDEERQRRDEEARRRATPSPSAEGATPAGQGGEEGEGGEESERPRYSRSEPAEQGENTRHALEGGPSTPTRAPREEVSTPSFAIVAAFEMKRVRQRGTFTIDLNKYTTDTLTLRFDENIGDLRRFWGNDDVFREVNTGDDAFFQQREVSVFLDGLNSQDFGEFVNFVTVLMKKRHAGGEETVDEVRIDRSNFNAEGNAFKLLYGWNGDNDRRTWLDYEYTARWSFFGGYELEEPWQEASFGAINMAPPLERRVVALEADPDAVSEAEIRAITVEVFYHLGDRELSRRVTLSPSKNRLSETIEYLAPAGEYDYDYEITWRLKGNRSVTSGRQSSNEALLFVDELPAS